MIFHGDPFGDYEWDLPPPKATAPLRAVLIIVAVLVVATVLVLGAIIAAYAHDSWISRGAYRNSVGEWCCGENDCASYDSKAVSGARGWTVEGSEFVPFEEATPSPDGKLWICRRPDHTRRCVFGPPPNS